MKQLSLIIFILLIGATRWAAGEPVTLSIWGVWMGDMNRGAEAAVRGFNRVDPTVKIEAVALPGLSTGAMDPQKLMCAVAGGNPPDVILADRFSMSQWAARGLFSPLNDFIERDKGQPDGLDPDDFYASGWREVCYEGQVYGIPNWIDDRALYYNKDMLIREGLVDEKGEARPPRDWNELRDDALRLTKRDAHGAISQIGFVPGMWENMLYTFGFLNGASFMSADGKRCLSNAPEAVQALEYLTNLMDALGGYKKVSQFASSFGAEAQDPFLLGQVAMKIDGGWHLRVISHFRPELNYDVAPPPAPPGKPSVSWQGGHCWAIPRGAKHPEKAWQFIKYIMSRDSIDTEMQTQSKYEKSRGMLYIPWMAARRSTNDYIFSRYLPADEKLQRMQRKFKDLLDSSQSRPATTIGQYLWNEHRHAEELVLTHTATPKEALERTARQGQEMLDDLFAKKNLPPFPVGMTVGAVSLIGIVLAGIALIVRRRKMFRGETLAGYGFASPFLIGFTLLTVWPVLTSFILSFCEYDILHPARWIGLENYHRMLFTDDLFRTSLWNTTYMVIAVPLGMAVGLGLALLLNYQVRGITVYRTLFYLPAIVPSVASSILWLWVLNPGNGLINSLLAPLFQALGADLPPWLSSPAWAKPSLVLMLLWGAGSSVVIWLAGLKNISQSYYEAAHVDGAGRVGQFFNITLPLLTPYIFFNLIMGIIGTFQIFNQAYIMTNGGPVNSTHFYAYYLFTAAFRDMRMGYASAMAWVLFFIVLALTVFNFKIAPRWVYYEGEK